VNKALFLTFYYQRLKNKGFSCGH